MSQVHVHAVAVSAESDASRGGVNDVAGMIDRVGRIAMRCSLVVIVGWIGAMKFTAYEAEGIAPFVANSPLMSWVYGVFSHRQFSAVLGVVELLIAALIAVGLRWPRAGIVGSAGAVGMFLTTISFMVTTPGVFEPTAGGFPALSVVPGQFLVKDFALFGISIWLLADSLRRVTRPGKGDVE